MNNKSDSFTSSSSKDKLPIEVGVNSLIRVFFGRFLTVLLATVTTLVFLVLAWFLADYSQFISFVLLVLAGIVFSLIVFSLFRKKISPIDLFLKRVVDISVSLLFLVFEAPLILLIAIIIKFDSKGPIFYYQKRIGKDGKEFKIFKFRTLLVDKYIDSQEEELVTNKSDSDPRITMVGRFLRRTSLDELPQIFNVLSGEMSLVGPRPLLISELDMFSDRYLDDLRTVKPGITGLWQLSRRHTIDSRILLDQYYIKNQSLWLDIVILLRTFTTVLRRSGAY